MRFPPEKEKDEGRRRIKRMCASKDGKYLHGGRWRLPWPPGSGNVMTIRRCRNGVCQHDWHSAAKLWRECGENLGNTLAGYLVQQKPASWTLSLWHWSRTDGKRNRALCMTGTLVLQQPARVILWDLLRTPVGGGVVGAPPELQVSRFRGHKT